MVTSSVPLRPPYVSRLRRTYEVVDDPSTDRIISWSHSGQSFIVWDPTEFSRDLLSRCFGHNRFSLFTSALNLYGFKKVDSELWEFADDDFVKGKPDGVRNIINRAVLSSDGKPSLSSLWKTTLKKQNAKSDADSRISTRKTILKKKKKNAKSDEVSRVSTRMTIPKKKKMNNLVAKAIADQLQDLQI